MTTRLLFLLSLTLTLGLVACPKKEPAPAPTPAPKTETPAPTGNEQQPDEANPTNTPVGETPGAQPVDVPMATMDAPVGTVMATDQDQATSFLNLLGEHPDAPRWVLTWEAGKGQLDFDSVTGILLRTTPDGKTDKYEGITAEIINAVAKGERGWAK